jgi:hypothetical protein
MNFNHSAREEARHAERRSAVILQTVNMDGGQLRQFDFLGGWGSGATDDQAGGTRQRLANESSAIHLMPPGSGHKLRVFQLELDEFHGEWNYRMLFRRNAS